MTNTKLTLEDIVDVRAYERERDAFRSHIIDLKKRRRVLVGPLVTFLFENRDTIRFQIQEMARVERLTSDDQIDVELRTYNPLIPAPGELSATMFIELTSDEEQRHWKPKLIGILDHLKLRIGSGDEAIEIRAELEEAHAANLTREIPPSVNFVRWTLEADAVERFANGPVTVVIDHENYAHETEVAAETVTELLGDLRG